MRTTPVDVNKLLQLWMEWEKGETPPGKVISNLKNAGLKEFLEEHAAKITQ